MPSGFSKKVVFKISYGHLYNTQMYVPQSRTRSYESTLPADNHNSRIGIPTQESNKTYGKTRIHDNRNAGGEGTAKNFTQNTLRNRDVYNKMKNKTVYGTSSKIDMHAKLNKL